MRAPYPSETKDRFMIRLPDGMREQIKTAADAANRTMNGEIIARLEASFQIASQSTTTMKAPLARLETNPLSSFTSEERISALEQTMLILIANISDLDEKITTISAAQNK